MYENIQFAKFISLVFFAVLHIFAFLLSSLPNENIRIKNIQKKKHEKQRDKKKEKKLTLQQ